MSYQSPNTLLNERAFLLFLIDGLQYYQRYAQPIHQGSVMDYTNGLHYRWQQMPLSEKEPYFNQVRQAIGSTMSVPIFQSLIE